MSGTITGVVVLLVCDNLMATRASTLAREKLLHVISQLRSALARDLEYQQPSSELAERHEACVDSHKGSQRYKIVEIHLTLGGAEAFLGTHAVGPSQIAPICGSRTCVLERTFQGGPLP